MLVLSMQFDVPQRNNEKLTRIIKRINSNIAIKTLWRASNVTAIDRLLINDHGPVHVKIVANISLRILRLLTNAGIEPSVCKDYKLTNQDSEVIVVLAAALHDIGHVVHRVNHEEFSTVLAAQHLPVLLDQLYEEEQKTIIIGEVLHAIFAHHNDVKALTMEAGILTIGDALDMEEGRARIPFDAGSTSIHAVSAISIKNVIISKGEEKPVKIEILMENPAGMFQVDFLLKKKIATSGIGDHFEIYIDSQDGKIGKRRIH